MTRAVAQAMEGKEKDRLVISSYSITSLLTHVRRSASAYSANASDTNTLLVVSERFGKYRSKNPN